MPCAFQHRVLGEWQVDWGYDFRMEDDSDAHTNLIVKAASRCATCGGAVDHDGRTFAPLTRPLTPRPASPVRPTPVIDDDPLPHLSPAERFNQAIERRDRTRARARR